MKKYLLTMAFISAFLMPTLCKAAFDVNLGYGAKNNDDVKEVQEFLKDQKLYFGPITGNYFSLTRSAVIRFQQKNKIKPANGQFTTTTREIAQKMIDPNQDVTTTMDAPTSYLEYPVGTVPMFGGQAPAVVPTMGGRPLAQVQAEALQTPSVQPVTPVEQTVVNVPVTTINNTTTIPVVETAKDMTPPKVVVNLYTHLVPHIKYNSPTQEIEYIDSNNPFWLTQNGGVNAGNCTNCIAVITDKPTTINLEYIKLRRNEFNGNYFTTSNNFEVDSQNQPIADGGIQSWNDNNKLSVYHILMLKNLFIPGEKYSYRFVVTDASGNQYDSKKYYSNGSWPGATASYNTSTEKDISNIDGVQTLY